MYSIKWRSSSFKSLLSSLGIIVGCVVLDAIMGGPISLASGLGKVAFNAGRTFIKKGSNGNSNFWSAHTKADESGK